LGTVAHYRGNNYECSNGERNRPRKTRENDEHRPLRFLRAAVQARVGHLEVTAFAKKNWALHNDARHEPTEHARAIIRMPVSKERHLVG